MSVKGLIIACATSVVVGAGGMVGLMQIPSVNSAVVKSNTNNSSYDSLEVDTELAEVKARNSVLEEENADLQEQNETLVTDLASARQSLAEKTASLNSALALIETKDVAIADKESEIAGLENEIDELNSQIETYESMLGEDIVYADMVGTLTSQLAEKTSALSTANAELEQLRTDKSSLQTRVAELELELADAEERLANYESLENIDRLNVSNFNGIWYKNGTFEDYYQIDNGIVVQGAGVDRGIVHNLNSQMYLFMNTAGSIPVELSVDGLSFSLGQDIYTKFYINTTETIIPSNIDFAGTYSHSTECIKFNVDNTLEFNDGTDTYYGAYIVTGVRSNVGGNVLVKYTITATIHEDEDDVIKVFEFNVGGSQVYCDNNCFSSINVISSNVIQTYSSLPSTNYALIRLELYDAITLNPNDSYSVLIRLVNSSGSNTSYGINGSNFSCAGGYVARTITYAGNNTIVGKYIDMYVSYSGSWTNNYLDSILFFNDVPVKRYLSFEYHGGSGINTWLSNNSPIRNVVENPIDIDAPFRCVVTNIVNDYINGTYENGESSIVITDNSATLQMTPQDEPIVANKTVFATTDGYHIYQTVTITYQTVEMDENDVETTVDHEIVMEFTDDECMSVTMDGIQVYPASVVEPLTGVNGQTIPNPEPLNP